MPAPHHSVFYRPDALPAANQQHQSTEGKKPQQKLTCKASMMIYDVLNINVDYHQYTDQQRSSTSSSSIYFSQ